MIYVTWASDVSPYAATVDGQWVRDPSGDVLAWYVDVEQLQECIKYGQILRSVHNNYLTLMGVTK